MYISNIEAHIGCLISNAKMYECIYIKSIDYEYISLHETSKLRRLIRQSNKVENVVTRLLLNDHETTNCSSVSPYIQTIV